ncbi:MAG: nucleotidyltransferase family protein [Ardenticatenaceae bacterium]|nr:nucleotidyltransferase family protein [Ardenticatenaceae bacterium]
MSLATTQLILDTLKDKQTPDQWESVFLNAGGDWDDLVLHAIVLGLAPQLYNRLSHWQLKPPTRTRAKLLAAHTAQAERNTAIYHQLGEFLSLCEAQAIHPIALKGVHLAACYYAEPALRPMNDIDLLFTPTELPIAEATLQQLGYGGKYKSADMGAGVTKHTSTFRRTGTADGGTSNPYLSADSDRTIEPHTSLEESWFGLKVDITSGIRDRAQTADLTNHTCLVLAPEDLLLHLCLHFCFHLIQGAPSMVQLLDLLTVCQKQLVDWDTFVERAAHYKATPFALAGLTLAAKLLAAPVPVSVLDRLGQATAAPMRRYIDTLNLHYIWERSQQKPLTTIQQRIQRGFLDRAETARWAVDWHGRFQVWRTLFQPGRTDTGQMILQQIRRNS